MVECKVCGEVANEKEEFPLRGSEQKEDLESLEEVKYSKRYLSIAKPIEIPDVEEEGKGGEQEDS